MDLPRPSDVEQAPDPKQLLWDALVQASGLSGRRLERFKQRFGEHRRQLLARLDRDGPVSELPAWQELVTAVDEATERLRTLNS